MYVQGIPQFEYDILVITQVRGKVEDTGIACLCRAEISPVWVIAYQQAPLYSNIIHAIINHKSSLKTIHHAYK